VRAQAVSLTVTVTGSGSSSSVDDNGHFMLTNVPAGRVDLHFVGNSVDAHLGLDNVAEHATLVITVRVSGHDAHLEDNHGNDDHGAAEVSGAIATGSISGSCAGHSLSFMVGTAKVMTNASTQFRDGTCESLKDGSQVDVKGTRQTDGSVLAASVEGDGDNENDDDQGNEVELKGAIVAGSIAGACPAHTLSFKVGTTKVITNASTQFKDGTCESLKDGSQVDVKGTRQTDGSVLAASVEGNGDNENDDDQESGAELKGAIVAGSIAGACPPHTLSFKVGSTTVRTNAATEFKDVSCASLKPGDSVEVKGARQSDASVMASRVTRET
jgi:hypothetical protein